MCIRVCIKALQSWKISKNDDLKTRETGSVLKLLKPTNFSVFCILKGQKWHEENNFPTFTKVNSKSLKHTVGVGIETGFWSF